MNSFQKNVDLDHSKPTIGQSMKQPKQKVRVNCFIFLILFFFIFSIFETFVEYFIFIEDS